LEQGPTRRVTLPGPIFPLAVLCFTLVLKGARRALSLIILVLHGTHRFDTEHRSAQRSCKHQQLSEVSHKANLTLNNVLCEYVLRQHPKSISARTICVSKKDQPQIFFLVRIFFDEISIVSEI
jgi:hypothetical protein